MHFILQLLLLVCFLVVGKSHADTNSDVIGELRIVTTDYEPYSYRFHDKHLGYSIEIVNLVLAEMEIDTQPEFLPWARTYKTALNRPNTLIFSIARTAEREKLFNWVAKLLPMQSYLYKATARDDISVQSLGDAKKYVVAGIIEGAPSQWLESVGFQLFNTTGNYDSRVRMLLNNRVDILIADPLSLDTELKKFNVSRTSIAPILYLPEPSYDLYLALSNGTPAETIIAFKKAMEKVVVTQAYKDVITRFEKRFKGLTIPN